jgi:aspartate ammonia-lyase
VDGITANVEHLHNQVEASVGVVTALTPYIGYEKAAVIAHEALAGKGTVRELVIAQGLMAADELDRVLSPGRLSGLTLGTNAIVLPTEVDESESGA